MKDWLTNDQDVDLFDTEYLMDVVDHQANIQRYWLQNFRKMDQKSEDKEKYTQKDCIYESKRKNDKSAGFITFSRNPSNNGEWNNERRNNVCPM